VVCPLPSRTASYGAGPRKHLLRTGLVAVGVVGKSESRAFRGPVIAPESRQSLSSRSFEIAIHIARKIQNRNGTPRCARHACRQQRGQPQTVHRDATQTAQRQHRAATEKPQSQQSRAQTGAASAEGYTEDLVIYRLSSVCLSAMDALYPAGEPRVRNAASRNRPAAKQPCHSPAGVQCSARRGKRVWSLRTPKGNDILDTQKGALSYF